MSIPDLTPDSPRRHPSHSQACKLATVMRTLEGKGHTRARVRTLPGDAWDWSPMVRRGRGCRWGGQRSPVQEGFSNYKDEASVVIGQKQGEVREGFEKEEKHIQ